MAEDVDSLFGRIIHPVAQSALKSECGKLTDFTKIVHEFLHGISSVYDAVGTNINSLVESNRRKVTDLTKDSLQYQSTTITAWNEMLEMWSEEANAHITFAKDLRSETVNTLHEQRLHVKDSVKRIYSYRDALNGTAGKEASETDKQQRDYAGNWLKHKQQVATGTTRKGSIMPTYTAYNNYLLQLSYSNGGAKSLLDIQMPNLMQELEVIQLNLHNLILSVLTYSWERQAHHFTDCLERARSGSEVVAKISPDTDVTNLGASITIPPEPIQINKDFIPADTADTLSEDLCNGYLAKEEYTSHTLGKRFKQVRNQLDKQDKTISKGNKDLVALAKLLSTYQENPTYGKSSEIEVQMSSLRHELRLLEMKQSGFSCQLGLLEESGVSVDSSGSMPSDNDFDDADKQSIVSVSRAAGEGEHEWETLSYTDLKTCDHCQRAIVLTKCYQCSKCKVNCHSSCKKKVFDCVGQTFTKQQRETTSSTEPGLFNATLASYTSPLVESTSSAATKLKDTMIGSVGGLFKGRRATSTNEVKRMSTAADPAPETPSDKRGTIKGSDEWWTIQRGTGGPDFGGFSEDEDDPDEDNEGIYDTIDRPALIKEIEEEEEAGDYQAPEDIHPSDSDSHSGRQTDRPEQYVEMSDQPNNEFNDDWQDFEQPEYLNTEDMDLDIPEENPTPKPSPALPARAKSPPVPSKPTLGHHLNHAIVPVASFSERQAVLPPRSAPVPPPKPGKPPALPSREGVSPALLLTREGVSPSLLPTREGGAIALPTRNDTVTDTTWMTMTDTTVTDTTWMTMTDTKVTAAMTATMTNKDSDEDTWWDETIQRAPAPSVIKQSDSRPPLPPPNLPLRAKHLSMTLKRKELEKRLSGPSLNLTLSTMTPPPLPTSLPPGGDIEEAAQERPLPSPNPTTLTKHPPKPGALYVCVALYAYNEQNAELYCNPGDRVDVYEEANSDWFKGECHGNTGYFPATYIEQVPTTGVVLRALYDYQANEQDEISLVKGQVIFQIEDQLNGWLYGKVKGHRGIFPSTYVETLDDFL